MTRLIDADALTDDILKSAVMIDDRGIQTGYEIAIELIKRQPTIDAKPVRHGKWIISMGPAKIYECSVCGKSVCTGDIECYRFCHRCGARMDGERDEPTKRL